ncbi:DUF7118 family protein [Haloferax mucosum]|uniref:DUF7118 family protein n=1 Tax=Haloferax mucosum TaxID=403181 RepID=UPI000677A75A|nr:hypothetical protein [Haloferax mucosum]
MDGQSRADDPVEAMQAAADDLSARRSQVAEIGTEELRALAEAYHDVATILDRYEAQATDRDDFQGYVEFRDTLSNRLESVPADVRHGEAFIEANETLTTGVTSSLSASDFDRAREQLRPAREDAALLDSLQDATETYRHARRALKERADEVEREIERLERVLELGEADIDAPVHELRAPIDSYNEMVQTAFQRFVSDEPSRSVLGWLQRVESYPLVETPAVPDRLTDYVETATVGDEPIATLVEYAGYSRSKLDHYVDDPQAFSAAVGANTRFLDTLDASALTVSWPPAPAAELRWRTKELVSVVSRFADDDVVARAREVHELTHDESFDRLRDAAVAREELTDDQRDRLRRGAVADELDARRDEYDRLRSCIDDHPPLDE